MNNTDCICDFGILRELRKREGLSITDLALQSGVSASVISKLERNRSKAEIDTIFRIARVFGLTLSDLISLAENRTPHLVPAEKYRSGDFNFRRVSYTNVRCMHASAKAGSKVSRPGMHRDDFELCWVLKGCLRVTLPNEVCELKNGTSIQFDALLEHTYEALEDSEIVITHIRKGKRF